MLLAIKEFSFCSSLNMHKKYYYKTHKIQSVGKNARFSNISLTKGPLKINNTRSNYHPLSCKGCEGKWKLSAYKPQLLKVFIEAFNMDPCFCNAACLQFLCCSETFPSFEECRYHKLYLSRIHQFTNCKTAICQCFKIPLSLKIAMLSMSPSYKSDTKHAPPFGVTAIGKIPRTLNSKLSAVNNALYVLDGLENF